MFTYDVLPAICYFELHVCYRTAYFSSIVPFCKKNLVYTESIENPNQSNFVSNKHGIKAGLSPYMIH